MAIESMRGDKELKTLWMCVVPCVICEALPSERSLAGWETFEWLETFTLAVACGGTSAPHSCCSHMLQAATERVGGCGRHCRPQAPSPEIQPPRGRKRQGLLVRVGEWVAQARGEVASDNKFSRARAAHNIEVCRGCSQCVKCIVVGAIFDV